MTTRWPSCLAVLFALSGGVMADDGSPALPSAEARLRALETRYQALRVDTERELQRLEREIAALHAAASPSSGAAPALADAPSSDTGEVSSVGAGKKLVEHRPGLDSPITVSGDFRLRYEHTTSEPDDPSAGDPGGNPARDRGVLRGRLAAEYRAGGHLTLGARITTGDGDDPNSTDVTLGNFTDDLEASLDRAYVELGGERALLVAGKFANPLAGTDLVWDGDVNPQGVAARFHLFDHRRLTADLTGIHAIVDEQAGGADSSMTGGQITVGMVGETRWSARLSAGFYDYSIGSLANADAGDVGGNRLDPAGNDYLSDFDLLDLLAEMTFVPGDPRWPVKLTADRVHNLGADDSANTGYSGTLAIGRAERPGDLTFGFGYSVAETDAVFAAYSHDNITYATNYRQHAVSIDYVPAPGMLLNLTGYRYRRDEPVPGVDDDPVTRIRLNWSFAF